ncbi:LysR family transcriptional regulator protein [Rhizobium etli 8C-3]|uniref:HTH-type transcriptional regulator TtuA n=2 Tax=Rhizobium TaxID=379 RepID=A0A4R3RW95_9HYPH|nr:MULTISPECIES: LysR family transcriptional regulator [Rhizobium]APO76812.1 LysR family transcriptional regulator protein [Rhizobium etli 8C-3]TCU23786.1 DNA-binding transcriptional LysR family regulator [Rhizobium azibense]TCU36056.1 DNA-binding transcriptional LysR family regulator [Rhizobium azibense]
MDKSDVTLERIRTFVRVAERGNLSAIAREMNIGQSSVTRHLRELEDALGVVLLSRTTRRVILTEEGSRYYADAIQILRLVEQATDEARTARGAAAGTVRISCTAALGVRHVSRLIFAFQDRYPEIAVDLNLTDERVDLVREGADIAIRLGPLTDSSMKLRALGDSRRILVGSPDYLARHGRPATPEKLAGLEGVRMSNIAGSDALTLEGPDGETHVVPFGGSLRVDHGLAAREAYLAGRGIGPAHVWLVDDLLSEGRLERILPDYAPPSVQLNILIVPDRADIARVRLLVEFLAEEALGIPGVGRSRTESRSGH